MARLNDKNSKRQKGFKILNGMKRTSRAVCLQKLISNLEIGEAYASTIYAAHRKQCKDTGVYVPVYRILDVKDGKRVLPYVSTSHVFKPKKRDHVTLAAARKAYIASNQESIKAARGLV